MRSERDPEQLAALNLRDTIAWRAQDLVDDMVHRGGADPADVAKFRTSCGDLAQLLESDYQRRQASKAHQLITDRDGRPVCLCGYDPAYLQADAGYTRLPNDDAAKLVQAHIRRRPA